MQPISRRRVVLGITAAGIAAPMLATDARWLGGSAHASELTPFLHGVASGDPLASRVILWTRVTPNSAHAVVSVRWRVACDPLMRQICCSGRVWTDAGRDFTVKVDATHLDPGTTYYYQFTALGAHSPVGRTRTLPQGHANRLRLAVLSCSNYPYGLFNVYGLVAQRHDLDAVVHLGDYLYEYANGVFGDGTALDRIPAPNREMVTLADYRLRHATYKTDPDLQECHRQHPFIAVWDDHESTNDSWMGGAENHDPDQGEGDWEVRKAVSIRAYFEWMPIRGAPSNPIYRRFRFGNLAEIDMLDTRLLGRDLQAASPADVATINDPNRQLLGVEQEQWLFNRLAHSSAHHVPWRLVGQQTMMGQLSASRGASIINVDQWDGYPAARARLFQHLSDQAIDNVVVLTGDIHSSWAIDLAANPYVPTSYDPVSGSGSLAVEFVGPSVTSPGIENPQEAAQTALLLRAISPHMKYIELNRHGYVLVDVDRDRAQGEWYHVDTIASASRNEQFVAAFATANGANHLLPATTPSAPRADAPEPAPAADGAHPAFATA